MSSTSIKVQSELKEKVQLIAEKFGLSLSAIVDSYFKQIIKTKQITFHPDEKLNKKTLLDIKKAMNDYKLGKASPTFDNAEDAIAWLEKQGV
ncbi:MAG TPA: type II toxin-antitoxin system RelB/DinJ family antitoxin [Xanthomonadales bacterium]|nr:type II toxin-antitoxin system RelB/DinJ family antitoxin [Xanthomonadales bacterium]